MRRGARRWPAASAALMLALAGCSQPLPPQPLRLGAIVFPGYEPLFLARQLGHLDPACVQLVEYVSATRVSEALQVGDIDAVALTLDEVLLQAGGTRASVFLASDYSNGADAVLARAGIDTLQGLAGRRVGVEQSALGAFMLGRALDAGGLALAEIHTVPLQANELEAAYRQGRVDAVVTFDPMRQRLVETGAVELFDSSRIPGEVLDVLAVAPGRGRPECLRELAQGWQLAVDHIRNEPRSAAQLMSRRLGVTPDEVLASLRKLALLDLRWNRHAFSGDDTRLADTARRLARSMLADGLLAEAVEVSAPFDRQLLASLYR